MTLVIGLISLGIIAVIVTQFVKSGSSGPTVLDNIFTNITAYVSLLK